MADRTFVAGDGRVDVVTTGNTSLRYDANGAQFVQNWKTPTAIGCYYVRVTGDGLLLSVGAPLRK